MKRLDPLFTVTSLLLVFAGCGRSPTSPSVVGPSSDLSAASAASGLRAGIDAAGIGLAPLPMQVGDRREFSLAITQVNIPPDGPPLAPQTGRGVTVSEIVGTRAIDGRAYLEEQSTSQIEGQPYADSWTLFYRQDRSGLYRFVPAGVGLRIVDLGRSSHGPGLGPAPGEVPELLFPLATGRSWAWSIEYAGREIVNRCTVEGVDRVDTPSGPQPAWRVRTVASDDGPDDVFLSWFGRDGLLRSTSHSESFLRNGSGEILYKLVKDRETSLTRLQHGTAGAVARQTPAGGDD